jgi:hypothetical protein
MSGRVVSRIVSRRHAAIRLLGSHGQRSAPVSNRIVQAGSGRRARSRAGGGGHSGSLEALLAMREISAGLGEWARRASVVVT